MICPKCGRNGAGNFCSYCGSPLPEEIKENKEGETRGAAKRQVAWREAETGSAAEEVREEKPEERDVTAGMAAPDRREEAVQSPPARAVREKREHGRKSDTRAKKRDQKEKKKMEKRLQTLEEERSRMEKERERAERRKSRESRNRYGTGRAGGEAPGEALERPGTSPGEAVAAGMAGAVVLMARVMQICCCLLMAAMVWTAGRAFLYGGDGLGNIESMITDRNIGLAAYVGFAGLSLLMGVIWCFWILSGKSAGGQLRLKKYDTGRGFFPFLLCAAAAFISGPAAALIGQIPGILPELAAGIRSALEAVNANREFLLFASAFGAGLSLIRKMLRV